MPDNIVYAIIALTLYVIYIVLSAINEILGYYFILGLSIWWATSTWNKDDNS